MDRHTSPAGPGHTAEEAVERAAGRVVGHALDKGEGLEHVVDHADRAAEHAAEHVVDHALAREDGLEHIVDTVTKAAAGEIDERAHAVQAAQDDRAALIAAFGGVRGMIDMTVPSLVFVLVYTTTKNLSASCWASFGLVGALAVVRLVMRETLQHAFSGVFGVAIGAFIAMKSGNAANFYLPGMLYTLAVGIVYVVSALVRWPLIGVLLGPVLGENLTWKTRNPGRYRAYQQATWAWALILLGKSAILFPLYFAGHVNWLGWFKVALGIPPFLLAVWLTWVFLSKAPPAIKVLDEADQADDAAEDAEQEQHS